MKNRLSDSLYFQRNLEYWNEVTPIHAWSAFYDVDGFRSGKTSLHSIELEELGDVSGKSMLHLQCHFGLDTLSWARMGARVTGVDFSDKAIKLARSLSSELGIEASFINSNVYDLPNKLKGQFDVVFTSYGVLCWLPDLEEWARVIGHFLKPGGTFYMAEDHPFATILRESNHDRGLELDSPYFHSNEPEKSSKPMSYTGSSARIASPNYEWPHTLGDVVEALVGAGLRIESLHEFPRLRLATLPLHDARCRRLVAPGGRPNTADLFR